MSNVASLDLCKELYEVSGWDYTEGLKSFYDKDGDHAYGKHRFEGDGEIPAYDLGFLLRKLPNQKGLRFYDNMWEAFHDDYSSKGDIEEYADTPEDAVAKLCLTLFEKGILTKDGQ